MIGFIKRYPRVSAAAALLILVLFAVLPGSGEDKLTIILRALALGFFIAFGFYCFRALRR